MTEKLAKAIDYAILALLGFTVAASLFFPPFSRPGLAVIYKAFMIIAGFLFIMSHKLMKEEFKIETPVDGSLFILFLWVLISTVLSRSPFNSFNSAVTFSVFLLFFYVTYNYAKKNFIQFLLFLAACSVVLSLYGLYQYFFGFDETLKYISSMTPENLKAVRERLESRRIFSTFIYPNTFAGFIILMIPVLLGLFKSVKRYRPYILITLALLIVNLILTKSVGAFISLIAGTFIVLLFVNDSSLVNFRRLFMILLAVCVVLLFVVIRIRGFAMFGEGVEAKLESYLKMIDVIKKYFIAGAGPGNFDIVYNNPSFGRSNYLKYAHNFLFQTAIEIGVVGLILLLTAIFRTYRAVIQNFYFIRTPRRKVLVFSILTGITAFLIHNLVDFDIYNFEIAVVFLVLLAALMSQINIGMIQLKKIKLTYLLGLNPGKRRMIILGCVMAALLLSAVTGGKQVYVLCLINTIIAVGFAIWSVSKEDLRRTNMDLPILLFLGWLGLSLFITPDINQGVKYITVIIMAVILFYLSSQFLRRYQFKISMTNLIIGTGTLLSLIAAGQYLYRFHAGTFPFADAFFPNADIFGAYMCMPFSLLLSKLLLEKNSRMVWPKIFLLLLMAVAVSLAHTKSGMLTLFFVFFGTWIYYKRKLSGVKDVEKQALFKKYMMISFCAVLALLSFTPITPSGEKMISVSSDPFYFNRLDIYRASLLMAKDRPIAGYGIGSYEKVFPLYNFPVKSVARYQMENSFAHNEPIQAAAATGFVGLAILIFLVLSMINNFPSYEGLKKLWAAKTGAYFAVLGIMFHSLFYFTLHVPGILFTVAVLTSIFTAEKSSIKTVPKEALLFTRIYYFPALIFAFIVFSFLVRPAAGNFLFTQYNSTGGYDFLKQASFADPFNARYHYERGLYFEKNGNLRTAVPFYENALKYDRLNCLYRLHLARAYSGLGDYAEADRNYALALRAAPYRAFTYSEYADFNLVKLNNVEKAQDMLAAAIRIEPYYAGASANLASIYWSQKNYGLALKEYDSIENAISIYTPVNDYERNLLFAPPGAIYRNKALLLMEMGKKNDSCSYYSRSLGLNMPPNAALEAYCGGSSSK